MHQKPFWLAIYSAVLFLLIFLWGIDLALPDFQLHVAALNVGQGDAVLITTPYGKHILVDGGPLTNVLESLPGEMGFFKNRIDLVVLTHPHSDHLAGLIPVLQRYEVPLVLLAGVETDSEEYRVFRELLQNRTVLYARADRDIRMEPGLSLDLLFPAHSLEKEVVAMDKLNNTSVAFRLLYGRTRVLFTGDADETVEQQILLTGADVKSTILKAGHHGSKYSTGKTFLDQVDPQYAIISAGKGNVYKHPHPDMLKRLEEELVETFRTDEQGTVKFTCGREEDCTVAWEKSPKVYYNTRDMYEH